jgi:murein DD-endopeptidase MepM/ murein hydrolase activator NlpD
MGRGKSNKALERALWGSLGAAIVPVLGCLGIILLVTVAIITAAGSILGWLFGGGAPDGSGNPAAPPGSAIELWTPTPIPDNCFVTPTPQSVTATPAPGNTPGSGTPPVTVWLPTPTPCPSPPNNWATPDPRYTPAPPGYGPRGSPYRARYVFTQSYGCTDFPEFKSQDCYLASNGARPWFHRGVDMVSMGDKTVYSTIEGRVEFAGWGGDGFGIRIYVRSGEFLVIYPHLSRVLIGVGQNVQWGQPVGVEGSTGYSTGSHLHYEIHINGAWVDSTPYLFRD